VQAFRGFESLPARQSNKAVTGALADSAQAFPKPGLAGN
jgi:hypothetical protein